MPVEPISIAFLTLSAANVTSILINNKFTLKRWLYTTFCLTDSIMVDKTNDIQGYTQLSFVVNKLMTDQKFDKSRRIISITTTPIDEKTKAKKQVFSRLVIPEAGYFLSVDKWHIDIEVLPDGYRVWSHNWHRHAVDKFIESLGYSIEVESGATLDLYKIQGLILSDSDLRNVSRIIDDQTKNQMNALAMGNLNVRNKSD